jgi:hypothetical protein
MQYVDTYFLPALYTEGPLGHFEHSLRGGDSPAADRKVLHKGCCGSLHGNGVRKEKPDPLPIVKKKCSLDSSCSDDSAWDGGYLAGSGSAAAAAFRIKRLAVRSQSSDCAVERRHRAAETAQAMAASTLPRRASSAVVAQRLYSTPTRAVAAKLRIGGGGAVGASGGGVSGSGGGEGSADSARPATLGGEAGGGIKADQEVVDQQQQQQRLVAQQQMKKGPSSGMSPSLFYEFYFPPSLMGKNMILESAEEHSKSRLQRNFLRGYYVSADNRIMSINFAKALQNVLESVLNVLQMF